MEPLKAPNRSQTYPLEMDNLPEEFVKKAEVELNETPENKRKCMKQLRELVENDNKLPSRYLDDNFLLIFLRCRKFDVQEAFVSLKKSVSFMRTHKKHLILKPYIREYYFREKVLSFMPHRDKDGCVILLVRLNKWDPSVADVDDCFSCNLLFVFRVMSCPMSQINGAKIMVDFNSNAMKYVRYCTPHYIRIAYGILQEVVPGRVKSIHVLNPSVFFRLFWALSANFLPEKVTRRVFVHRDHSELRNYFPKSLIPDYLGGCLKDQDIPDWVAKAKFPGIVDHLLREPEA